MAEREATTPTEPHELRQQAESIVGEQTPDLEEPATEGVPQWIHELQVHQIELQMQNEALRAAQAELESSRDRYAELYDFAPVGYATLDPQGVIREINLTACGMLGWERSRLLGGRLATYVVAGEKRRFANYLRRCGQALPGEEVTGELMLQANPPEALSVLIHAVVAADPGDGDRAYRIAITDVTERRQADADLRESEERYRRLLAVLPVAMYSCDAGGAITYFNDPAAALWGRAPRLGDRDERFCGAFRLFRPDGSPLPHAETPMATALREGCSFRGEEVIIQRPDGSRVRVSANIDLLRDAAGRVCGAINVLTDITERKRAEEAISSSLREKEVLLKEVHHRVKNNMQVISSLLALQAEEAPESATRALLLDVSQRVQSMALVHEKLYGSTDLARVEFAEYAQSLLEYLWRAHETSAPGRRLNLVLDLEPVSLPVNTAVPCGLILNELLTNALKHAFRGRESGEVGVSLRGGPQGQVCLCVRDNGNGLPPGTDWRQSRSLGLRLVQMLAGQLHATVEVATDEGTTFMVMFGGPEE